MKQLTISINEKQEEFLKRFAEKHHDGADDNLHTADAFHVVENKRYDYIPYSSDLNGYFEDLPLTFTYDQDYEVWWDDEIEMIRMVY
ncbi:hypothetical protein [Cytobacillus praedii]|uniref:hypothetical protein n=1 Tax=Cytobacillus praedii TaxID=1742358 RepID=UPI002E220B31|nr:hypothetical protein [Cytobacillus praedii]